MHSVKEMSILIDLHNITIIKDLCKRLKFKSSKDLEHSMHNRLINLPHFLFNSQSTQTLIKLSISSKYKSSFIKNASLRKCHSSSQKFILQQEVHKNNIDSKTSI